MLIRFDHPAETRRPNGKSQRFDVFDLKIERPLTLFHRHAINTWIDLERAPEISWYCERPLLIDHAPFKRLVDFYAIRHGEEEIWFVSGKPAASYPTSAGVGTISSMFNTMEIGHAWDGRKTIA